MNSPALEEAMQQETLNDAMDELSSAEDFLNYFGIEFDPVVVHINRLHIMQRFHDYLQKGSGAMPDDCSDDVAGAVYTNLLQQAYQDFVQSDAQTEKVFKVFRMNEPQTTFVSLESLLGS